MGYAFFQLRLLRLRLMKRKATRKKIVNTFIYKGLISSMIRQSVSGRYSFFLYNIFPTFPSLNKSSKRAFSPQKTSFFRKNTLLTPRNLAQELCLSSV